MPPLLADFSHARACKPFCEKYLTLPTKSYREAARQFEINDHNRVRYWERIYLEEGPEGLYIERRGRGSKGRPPKKLRAEIEEDLLAEVQRLRAENAYLKKLNALVAERVRQERKQK